jgi:hypothetical protein
MLRSVAFFALFLVLTLLLILASTFDAYLALKNPVVVEQHERAKEGVGPLPATAAPNNTSKVWICSRPTEDSRFPDYTGVYLLHWIVVVEKPDGTIQTYSFDGSWWKDKEVDLEHTGWWWRESVPVQLSPESVEKAYKALLTKGDAYDILRYNCRHAATQLVHDALELENKKPSIQQEIRLKLAGSLIGAVILWVLFHFPRSRRWAWLFVAALTVLKGGVFIVMSDGFRPV